MGGSSAIAEAVARELVRHGASLVLAGRSGRRLEAIAQDLKVRGAPQVETLVVDARDIATTAQLAGRAYELLGGLDMALIAHGVLPDQAGGSVTAAALEEYVAINTTSALVLASQLAELFERQRSGVLALISSVAGDRGRASNYLYGSTKAALNTFASGLRQRLWRSNVKVLTIKPGFVDTPMTASFKKGLLWASADSVGKSIAGAMIRGRNAEIYVPSFWRLIMMIIRAIPEGLFKRVTL